jgi:hypothetical protein
MRATAAEPTLPKILAVKKPAMVPEDEDVADEEGDDSVGDEDISFDDFMDEAGIDVSEDDEDDAAPDSEYADTEAEPDMDVDSLTHAEEPVPKKPLPKPGKPGKAKPAVPAKQPAPVAQVAPPADMAENLPQPDQAVSDMDAAVKAAQRERSALEAKQQQQQQQQAVAPVTSASVSSMRGVCDAMTQAGFKFALVNLQRDLLSTMEDNGLINEAKKIAGIIAKDVVADQIGKRTDPLIGAILWMGLHASDTADTRSWRTLPHDFQVLRIRLPGPGNYSFKWGQGEKSVIVAPETKRVFLSVKI